MTVACKDEKCYYYDRGFCSNELTAIDRNGMCEAVWHNGQPRPSVKEGRRMPIHILNIVKKEKEFNEDEYVVPEKTESIEENETTDTGCMDSPESTEPVDECDTDEVDIDNGDSGEAEPGDSESEGADDGDSGDEE